MDNLQHIEEWLDDALRLINRVTRTGYEESVDYETLGNVYNDLNDVLAGVREQLFIRYM